MGRGFVKRRVTRQRTRDSDIQARRTRLAMSGADVEATRKPAMTYTATARRGRQAAPMREHRRPVVELARLRSHSTFSKPDGEVIRILDRPFVVHDPHYRDLPNRSVPGARRNVVVVRDLETRVQIEGSTLGKSGDIICVIKGRVPWHRRGRRLRGAPIVHAGSTTSARGQAECSPRAARPTGIAFNRLAWERSYGRNTKATRTNSLTECSIDDSVCVTDFISG